MVAGQQSNPKQADVNDDLIALLIHQHRSQIRPALERLWAYYRNDLDFSAAGEHRQYAAAQEQGLPRRIRRCDPDINNRSPREIVIENDIGWRVHTLVDFMFGQPISVQSLCPDRDKAALIERVLTNVFDANGGIGFFQDMALLGGVYGFVDLMLRVDRLPPFTQARDGRLRPDRGSSRDSSKDSITGPVPNQAPSNPDTTQRALRFAANISIETVEAPRAVPVMNPDDYRKLDAYLLHYTQQLNRVERNRFLARLIDRSGGGAAPGRQVTVDVTEHWTDQTIRVYHAQKLIDEMVNPIGRLPVVHIQNLPQPFFYEGLSEVEPLIPLQDELNTRLSDRANRVTFQSFKMYLGKGIENFLERPISPGQMWTTDNPDATIETFGGDAANPSEDTHINEIREAMDKTSAVTAAAAGLIRNKIGNLTSENALRIVMMGLLARTQKKRITYGAGIERLCELVLHTMDLAGVLPTQPDERRIRIHWPSPIPENTTQRLQDAEIKKRLGVPEHVILAELGYGQKDREEIATTM
ncbi:MAG: phage portal protein [Phycisphaeraceae bacterium]